MIGHLYDNELNDISVIDDTGLSNILLDVKEYSDINIMHFKSFNDLFVHAKIINIDCIICNYDTPFLDIENLIEETQDNRDKIPILFVTENEEYTKNTPPILQEYMLCEFIARESLNTQSLKAIMSCMHTVKSLYKYENSRRQDMSDISYMMINDMYEPLYSIIGMISLMNNNSRDLDPTTKYFFKSILSCCDDLQNKVDHIYKYCAVDKDNKKDFEYIYIAHIIESAIEKLDSHIKDSKAKITVNIPNNIKIYIITKLIINVFIEIIKNAIIYNNNEPEISIDLEETNREWLIKIKDNGIGIHKKLQKKIFEISERSELDQSRVGVIMGIATCKRIIQLHSGKMWIESKIGKGSCFYFSIAKP